MTKIHVHEPTDREMRVLKAAEEVFGPRLDKAAKGFFAACVTENISARIAGGATSLLLLTTAAKAQLVGSGVPATEMNREVVDEITQELQLTLAGLITEFIEKNNRRDVEEN